MPQVILSPVAGDNSTAINNAINSLPLTGGDVIFNPGQYNISSSINIGNGTKAAVSTRYGVRLVGLSDGAMFPTIPGMPTTAGVKFFWTGAGNGVMVKVNGPLQGWGLKDIFLDANSGLAGGCLGVFAGQLGVCENITTWMASVYGIGSFAHYPQAVGHGSSLHNVYRNVNINVPTNAWARGILLSGDQANTGPNEDTDFAEFYNTFISQSNTSNTTYGIVLRLCDTCYFYDTHIAGGGGTGSTGILFDYTYDNGFPNSCSFFGLDNGAYIPYATSGIPSSNCPANFIYGLSLGNAFGGPSNNKLPNLAHVNYNAASQTKITPIAVAELSTPSAGSRGARAMITDSSVVAFGNFGRIVAAGGSNTVPVYCDGAAWRIG